MSNQYIVQFKNITDDEFTYSFAELYKGTYDIPILSIRTHEKNVDPMNRILFHQFITSNFGEIEYSDENMECMLSCLNNDYVIKFDKNSSSAFTEFKKQLSTLFNSKFETEYYPSGNVLYTGTVLHVMENGTIPKRQPHGHGILYYDLPDHNIKYSGEFENGIPDGAGVFYDKLGKIKLTANNISSGIPTQKGKLELFYKFNNQVVTVDFFDLWDELDIDTNANKVSLVMSDTFLVTLVKNVCDFSNMIYENVLFNEKSLDEKIISLHNLVHDLQTEQIKYHEYMRNSNVYLCNVLVGVATLILLNNFF
jgi:hypothetical protein